MKIYEHSPLEDASNDKNNKRDEKIGEYVEINIKTRRHSRSEQESMYSEQVSKSRKLANQVVEKNQKCEEDQSISRKVVEFRKETGKLKKTEEKISDINCKKTKPIEHDCKKVEISEIHKIEMASSVCNSKKPETTTRMKKIIKEIGAYEKRQTTLSEIGTYQHKSTVDEKRNTDDLHEKIITLKVSRKEKAFKSYTAFPVNKDGNGLFRSFSFALYYHEKKHSEIRKNIVDYVSDNWADTETVPKSACPNVREYESAQQYSD